MLQKLKNLEKEALKEISQAPALKKLEKARVQYLGRNGSLNKLSKQLPQLSSAQKKEIGQKINYLKNVLGKALEKKGQELEQAGSSLIQENLDQPSLPINQFGHLHLVSQAIEEIALIFSKIGFERVRHPEVDWEWFAFETLNMPKDHPARDEWETLFVDMPKDKKMGKMVLTPHTSNGQVREMLNKNSKPPIRMINIAKCYRRQQDITHTVVFHQFEGLLVDKNIHIGHLKGVFDYFAKNFYGAGVKSRIRPFNFKFTEPSFEVDFSCSICQGKGCRTCKSGWHEVGGAGMVHPNVLKAGGINPEIYTGFAFGWGVERTYMMKSGIKIPDIRILYQNDIRFLEQF